MKPEPGISLGPRAEMRNGERSYGDEKGAAFFFQQIIPKPRGTQERKRVIRSLAECLEPHPLETGYSLPEGPTQPPPGQLGFSKASLPGNVNFSPGPGKEGLDGNEAMEQKGHSQHGGKCHCRRDPEDLGGKASEGQGTLGRGTYLPLRKLCCSEALPSL